MNLDKATFGGGCFWCTEAIFQKLKGVKKVSSGYAGGNGSTDYESVSNGATGHAEVIQVEFDPTIISYETILEVFFHLHDPTTLNRQGADVGTQYRSIIFFHNESQRTTAENLKQKMEKEKIYKDPIVTEIIPFESFHSAEGYHQNYYENNKESGYCRIVIDPKIKKLYREFGTFVKSE